MINKKPIIPDNLYETFFSGINCEMWEKAATPDWTNAEVEFKKNVCNLPVGASILDMPCGTGRHSVRLSAQGFQLTAVDISETFIAGLRKKADEQHLNIKIIQGNILSLYINGLFDGAFCFGNSFGYFDYEGMKTFVQNVSSSLKTGAKWIINSGLLAESFLNKFVTENVYQPEGFTMHVHNNYDVWNSCLLTTLTYTKNGETEVHCFKHYVYTVAGLIRLLQKFNLKTIALYSSTDKTEYNLGDAQVYLVAEKN